MFNARWEKFTMAAALGYVVPSSIMVVRGKQAGAGSVALRSSGSATLSIPGYLGTYISVPAGGATVKFTVNPTATAGAGANPHLVMPRPRSVRVFSGDDSLVPEPASLGLLALATASARRRPRR